MAKAAGLDLKTGKYERKAKSEERENEIAKYKLLFHCLLLLQRMTVADGTVKNKHVKAVVQHEQTTVKYLSV